MLYVMVRRRVVILSPLSSVVWLPSIASQSRALWTRVLRLLDCSPKGSGLVEAFSRFNGNLYSLQQQSLLASTVIFTRSSSSLYLLQQRFLLAPTAIFTCSN